MSGAVDGTLRSVSWQQAAQERRIEHCVEPRDQIMLHLLPGR